MLQKGLQEMNQYRLRFSVFESLGCNFCEVIVTMGFNIRKVNPNECSINPEIKRVCIASVTYPDLISSNVACYANKT